MHHCFICRNKTDQKDPYQLLCIGCATLLKRPQFSCQQCGIDLKTPQDLCGQCQSDPPTFTKTHYATTYQAPIDQWIMSYKFNKNLKLSRLFAELIHHYTSFISQDHVLVPVPLHTMRLRSRGYNQAYEIAVELAKLSKRKIQTSLQRHKNTAMQSQLSLAQRNNNVRNAFVVNKSLKHKKIILIDDVMTTGNTVNECAKALKKCGVTDIQVVVFARKFLS